MGNRWRINVQGRGALSGGAAAWKSGSTGEHLVHDDTEGEDVCTRIGLTAFQLFGRHVTQGSRRSALWVGSIVRRSVGRRGRVEVPQLRDAEVEQFHTRPRQHDILRLK